MERLISVIGGHRAEPEILQEAEKLGRGLAERGLVLVCGGLGGVMEAACRGAKEAGGKTIGILPGANAAEANRWVDISLPTDIGLARNAIVARAGEAVIALDGSYGTLSEIAFALNYGSRVIGIRTWKIDGVRSAADAEEALKLLDRVLSSPRRGSAPRGRTPFRGR